MNRDRIVWRRVLLMAGIGLPWILPSPARTVEVSLEENKAERGNIGYVDLQRLFREYPETQKEKQKFEDLVRQSEDQVNLRKAEVIGLRAELARLRMERDFIAKNPLSNEPPSLPGLAMETPPAAPSPDAHDRPSPPDTVVSTAAVAHSSATASSPTVSVSTAAAAAVASSTQTVPISTQTVSVSSRTASGSTQTISTQAVAGSTTTPTISPGAASPLANLPGLAPEVSSMTSQTPMDAKIAETAKLLEQKESDFKKYQSQVEQNLINLENRKTEILLGKIYKAVQEVARSEGVSVIVDKSQILFGHKAVDMTEKALQRLKGL